MVAVNVMPSILKHSDTGLLGFVERTVSKRESIVAYYGLGVYTDLLNQMLSSNAYGLKSMAVVISTCCQAL